MLQGLTMLVALLTSAMASTEDELKCKTCLQASGELCYNTSYLFDIEAPFRNNIVISKMGILHSSNILYFSFEPSIQDPEYYKIGFIDLDNPQNASVISAGKQIMNFGTFDIDQDNGIIYLGGSDGIYSIDTKVNRVGPFSSRGDTVLSIFYKGYVYFVRDGENKIVRKKDDIFDILVDSMRVKNFVINRSNVIIFLSNFGLYAQRNKELVRLSNNAFIRGLTIDLDDVVYAWWVDGIYKVIINSKLETSRLIKFADIPGMGAMTFDNVNHILFTSDKSIYKLTPVNNTFCLKATDS